MTEPRPSERVVLQRIRNRIIEVLETFSSFEEQRNYALRVPIVYVPYELVNSWEDWVPEPRPSHFTDPVFSEAERLAIEAFHGEWKLASDSLPDDWPSFEQVLVEPYWARLRHAASNALKVFESRGRLSEDVEAA